MPPSWTGGNSVTGLRSDGDMALRRGMTFHILSWLMGAGQMGAGQDRGDYFVSDTVLLGEAGAEVLTRTPTAPTVRARSEEHTSELPSLMRISYAVFYLKHKRQS